MTIHTFFEQKILLMVLAGIFMCGFIVKLCVAKSYRKLVTETESIAQSEHSLCKLLLLKFEACSKINQGVANVDVFVDKYIYSYKTMGAHLYTWENVGNQFLVIIMIISVASSMVSGYYNLGQFAFFSTILSGFSLSALLVLTDSMINLSTKKNLIKIQVKDYLENIYRLKLETGMLPLEEDLKDFGKEEIKWPQENDHVFHFSKEEEEVIEEVLKEYMA